MTKLNFKKSVMTSLFLRQQKNVSK